MYSNELLDEKYQAQAALVQQAEAQQMNYVEAAIRIAQTVFEQHGWTVRYAKRKGGYIEKQSATSSSLIPAPSKPRLTGASLRSTA